MLEIDEAVAAAVGYRLRGGPLVEQAGTTKSLALTDMPQFKQEKLLGDPDIAALDTAIANVVAGLQDRTTNAAETHLQTAEQVNAVDDLKADRRRLMECVTRVFRHRPELAEFRQGHSQGSSVSALCTDINRKLALAKEHESELAAVGAGKDLLDRIEAKLHALEASSGAQEAAVASLPTNTRTFCIAKGRLYYQVKDIINAGRALHARDPERAATYNLRILYRRAPSKAKPEPEPAPVPTLNPVEAK